MNNDQIQQAIDALRKAAGVASEAYVRQVYVQAVQEIVGALIALAVAVTLATMAMRCFRRGRANAAAYRAYSGMHPPDDGEGWYFGGAFATFGTLVASIITLCVGMDAIGRLLNPNYYAIQDVLSAIHR